MNCPRCSAPFEAPTPANGEIVTCTACGMLCDVHNDFALDLTTGEEMPVLFLEPLEKTP